MIFINGVCTDGKVTPNIGDNGGMDVNIQDQTSPALMVNANQVTTTTVLTSDVAIDDATIDVSNTVGFIDGAFIVLASVTDNRYSVFHQVGAIAGSTVTLDSPMDFAYTTANTVVTSGTDEMSVNGAVTTQIFSLRASDPGIPLVVDITRIIIHCITASAVDLSLFGDLTELTNGLVLRRVDGTYQNIFNVKSNHDMAGLMYDWTPHAQTNPVQGVDGFVARLTFGGQNKIGVVIRLGPGEDLEFLVQDDLSGITSLQVTFEGHVVVD